MKKLPFIGLLLIFSIFIFSSDKNCKTVGPFTKTKWRQDDPYNYYSKIRGKNYAGCGAVALSQLFYFHKTPIYFDYTIMPYEITKNTPESSVKEVARIIYRAGVSANQSYWTDRAFAPIEQFMKAFERNGYYSVKIVNWFGNKHFKEQLKKELDEGRPVFYYIVAWHGILHYVLIDGYKKCKNSDIKFHINWGWGKKDDNYYDLDNINAFDGKVVSDNFTKYSHRFISAKPGVFPSDFNVIRNKYYKFKCADVVGKNKQDGANVQLFRCHGGSNQLWQFVEIRKNVFKIISQNSKKCLDVKSPANKENSNIQQYTCHETNDQLWKLKSVRGNYFQLISLKSNLCLATEKDRNGKINIVQKRCFKEVGFQLWKILPGPYKIRILRDNEVSHKNGAVFYEHHVFNKARQGKKFIVHSGQEFTRLSSKGMNDNISSYKIGGGVECVITKNPNFTGEAVYLTANSYGKYMPMGFNDSVSSLKCDSAGFFTKNSKHESKIYEHPYFSGKTLKLRKGLKIKDLGKVGFNNKISSVRIWKKARFKCVFYRDKNFKRKILTVVPGASYDNLNYYKGNLNDSISSLICM